MACVILCIGLADDVRTLGLRGVVAVPPPAASIFDVNPWRSTTSISLFPGKNKRKDLMNIYTRTAWRHPHPATVARDRLARALTTLLSTNAGCGRLSQGRGEEKEKNPPSRIPPLWAASQHLYPRAYLMRSVHSRSNFGCAARSQSLNCDFLAFSNSLYLRLRW